MINPEAMVIATASTAQTGHGQPVCARPTQATAPIISASPWAKLISRKIEKTIASPMATSA